jgi:hypothetical protein
VVTSPGGPELDEAERARRLADEVRPILGAVGFTDTRIDDLSYAFVVDRIGEGSEEFLSWAQAQGPCGLDPQLGF